VLLLKSIPIELWPVHASCHSANVR